MGFDNIRFSEYILPPLSTIEMSQAQLGRLAFQALAQRRAARDAESARNGVYFADQFCLARVDRFASQKVRTTAGDREMSAPERLDCADQSGKGLGK
jgi:hypothetical protein